VEIVGRRNVGWFHSLLAQGSLPAGACDNLLTLSSAGSLFDYR
jgi:hypothetical protein